VTAFDVVDLSVQKDGLPRQTYIGKSLLYGVHDIKVVEDLVDVFSHRAPTSGPYTKTLNTGGHERVVNFLSMARYKSIRQRISVGRRNRLCRLGRRWETGGVRPISYHDETHGSRKRRTNACTAVVDARTKTLERSKALSRHREQRRAGWGRTGTPKTFCF
jgi:hypothetical protein